MQDIILVGGVRGNNAFTPAMAVPAIETMPDDVVPQPQLKATDSGLGSTSSSISVKGKEHATPLIPLVPPSSQALSSESILCTGPSTTSSAGKRSCSDMTSDDSTSINMSSVPLFSNASQSTGPAAKKINLAAAMATASVPSSCKSKNSQQSHTTKSLMLGMQGSLNLLTSLLNNSNITAEDKVSARRELMLTMLQEQDGDLRKDVKAFIRAMISHSSGFTDVYLLTADKGERTDFVQAEVEGMRNKLLAKEPVTVAIPEPF